MNICILGATGRVGSVILENALRVGYSVKALVRNPSESLPVAPNLSWVSGNALNKKDLQKVIVESDVVISALNSDGNSTLATAMPLIIDSMTQNGVKRIITIGTAGILQSHLEPSLYRFQSKESRNRSTKAAEDHLQAYLALKKSGLDWTVVCPTYLPNGDRTNQYRFEVDYLPVDGLSISTFDTADFAFDQISSSKFVHYRVGLAY